MSTGSSPIIYSTGLGPQGPQGEQGPQGPKGPQGPPKTGSTGNTGSGVTGIKLVSAGIGFSFGINGVSGATLLFTHIAGFSGISSQKGTNSIVFLDLKGITTTGFSILGLNSSRTYKGELNSAQSGYSFDIIEFSTLKFKNITTNITNSTIELTGLCLGSNPISSGASAGNLAKEIIFNLGNTLINFTKNNNWNSDARLLHLSIPYMRETDISGNTGQLDNYRKDSVGTLASETQFKSMPISGITGPVILNKPISTISGSTLQSALYLFDTYSTGSTNSHIVWFRPLLESGRTALANTKVFYGSCVLSNGNCLDYVTQSHCTKITGITNGSNFFVGKTCDGITTGKIGCCYWDFTSKSFKCQDARPEECLNFKGIVKTLPCSQLPSNTCFGICLPCDNP
jgi:hypothetical protein